MLKVYMDSEFTTILPGRKLISIGLVDQHGERSFYAELTDGYHDRDCSDFVHEVVLPHLDAPSLPANLDYCEVYAKMSRRECAEHLANWIACLREPVEIVSDAAFYDFPLLVALFDGSQWPVMLAKEPRTLPTGDDDFWLAYGGLLDQEFNRNPVLRQHHALDDAKAMRAAMESVFARKPSI